MNVVGFRFVFTFWMCFCTSFQFQMMLGMCEEIYYFYLLMFWNSLPDISVSLNGPGYCGLYHVNIYFIVSKC